MIMIRRSETRNCFLFFQKEINEISNRRNVLRNRFLAVKENCRGKKIGEDLLKVIFQK